MASLDVLGTKELSAINDLITRLCASFSAVSRPEVFHLVREEYERHDPAPAGVSICALVEQTCVERLQRMRHPRVA